MEVEEEVVEEEELSIKLKSQSSWLCILLIYYDIKKNMCPSGCILQSTGLV